MTHSKPDIVVVSGIHTAGDKGGMEDLAKVLRKKGYTVDLYPYPTRWALSIYRKKVRRSDAYGLLNFCRKRDNPVIISHSNGSLITQDAMNFFGLQTEGWISLGGAATSDKVDYTFYNFDWAISVFNPHDLALKAGAILPWHAFGRLGSEGYRGSPTGKYDTRWMNVNGASSGFGINHSHYTGKELLLWAEFCDNNITTPYSQKGIIRP